MTLPGQIINSTSVLIWAIVIVTIAIFLVVLVLRQKKVIINKPLGAIAAVLSALSLFALVLSVNTGTVVMKTQGDPQLVLQSFFNSLIDGDDEVACSYLYGVESLGLNNEEADVNYLESLRNGYSYETKGEMTVDGMEAVQTVTFYFSDISEIKKRIEKYIEENIITEPDEDMVNQYYDEEGVYRTEYIDSLYEEGLKQSVSEGFTVLSNTFEVKLRYVDNEWKVIPDSNIFSSIKGEIIKDSSQSDTTLSKKYDLYSGINVTALNDKSSIYSNYLSDHHEFNFKTIYRIEKGGQVPRPDPNGYHEYAYENASDVMELVSQAVEYGLMEEGEALFTPQASFRNRGTIQCYLDETILVIMWKEEIDGKILTLSEIKIGDASQLRRKIADDTYGSATQYFCSELTKQVNSVVSMNSDFYGFRAQGITCYEGEIHRTDTTLDTLFIDDRGDFHFYDRRPNPGTDEEKAALKSELQQYVDDNHIEFSLSFGPALIKDGVVQDCSSYPIGQVNEKYSRSSISQLGPLHYLYCNVAYASAENPGCELSLLAKFLSDKGVKQAYNLDGGQTSEIIFNGKIYNLLNYNDERTVSDIVYFSTALPESERGN